MAESADEKRERNRRYQREWAKKKRRLDPSARRRDAEAAREWQRRNPIRNAWNQYRAGARNRGLAFEITDSAFAAFVLGDCYYCGAKADPINGIDRLNSGLGYVGGNIVTACKRCNYAKRDYSLGDFLAWAGRVVAHRGGSG